MKKKLLISVLSISLFVPTMKAADGWMGSASSLFSNCAGTATKFFTPRNADIASKIGLGCAALAGYEYVGRPLFNRATWCGERILDAGKRGPFGIRHISRMAAWIASLPARARNTIDPYAGDIEKERRRQETIQNDCRDMLDAAVNIEKERGRQEATQNNCIDMQGKRIDKLGMALNTNAASVSLLIKHTHDQIQGLLDKHMTTAKPGNNLETRVSCLESHFYSAFEDDKGNTASVPDVLKYQQSQIQRLMAQ